MKHIKRNKLLTITLLCLGLSFIVLQFFNEPIAQASAKGQLEGVPEEVSFILERSCYNCHSNTQQLSFFDKIAPISWIVNKDIKRAREVMNFSEWDKLSEAEKKGKFYAIFNMVKAGKMPLPSYILTHPESKLSKIEIETIKQFALSLSEKDAFIPLNTVADTIQTFQAQQTFAALGVAKAEVPVSPNGITYNADFKSWKVIGMSTLIDNSIRIIYGNDIAVKAIAAENFHPWPDGSAIAKAVFKQTKKANGEIVPGDFVNMQYMVKDKAKYSGTEGWGFAKFNGHELKPTGKTALFAQQSCISCHRQLAASTGFLFNVPPKVNSKKLIENYLKTLQNEKDPI
ncbi:MAG: heme-binding domain-containing protein [Sphingobacterium sp.]|jgi:hypothetical protein|uniref:heme-binding domain-containing protein n=1 Tax=Sphingobacterium sp. TaxID=341027 RepID=UPI00284196C1|nr:heme-binding domain-containing protein [Sphingobacterium sp.]MDR3006398.1 heme-binding domain-containing protein [Sphingobacterium sp.]